MGRNKTRSCWQVGAHLPGCGGSPRPGTLLQGCGIVSFGPCPSHSSGLKRRRKHIRGNGFGERWELGLLGRGKTVRPHGESPGDPAPLRTHLSINASLSHPSANHQALAILNVSTTHSLLSSPTTRSSSDLLQYQLSPWPPGFHSCHPPPQLQYISTWP